MARSDNFYSLFVSWTKIILPLIALAMLSSIFLLPREYDPRSGINISQVDIDEMAQREQFSRPQFAGVTEDGVRLTLSASTMGRQLENALLIDMNDIQIGADQPNGTTMNLSADYGIANTGTQTAVLSENVSLSTSDGITMSSEEMHISMKVINATSPGQIHVEGPQMVLDAGAFELRSAPEVADGSFQGYVLDFKKGVKLVYTP